MFDLEWGTTSLRIGKGYHNTHVISDIIYRYMSPFFHTKKYKQHIRPDDIMGGQKITYYRYNLGNNRIFVKKTNKNKNKKFCQKKQKQKQKQKTNKNKNKHTHKKI